MQNIEDRIWDISCTKDIFDTLKRDERFLNLLTLARFFNALRFCQQPITDVRNSDNPSASRQRFNSFLFASSVLYEGFLLVEKLGQYFRDFDSFKNGFAVLLRDRKIRTLRETALKRMRNKFVFHFDVNVALEALEDFELQNYRFATGFGNASGEVYYRLADEAVMNYLLQHQPKDTDGELNKRFRLMMKEVTELMEQFTEAAERLIAEVLVDMGWTAEIREKIDVINNRFH
ncbi:hypothetical protein ACFL7M_16600 [Thermodesulfobacteriota bacterium]